MGSADVFIENYAIAHANTKMVDLLNNMWLNNEISEETYDKYVHNILGDKKENKDVKQS